MNRKEFVRSVAKAMREQELRKPVSIPKQVFHISDDEGNHKDFVVQKTDKNVLYTEADIELMLDACIGVTEDALKRGDNVTIRGFGSLGLKYRQERATKNPITKDWVKVAARYIPRFSFGNDLRMCAKIYELSLAENNVDYLSPPDEDDKD